MCGIAGIARGNGSPVDARELEPMAKAIEHRGPDQGGTYTHPGIGLAIRRLSIIDLVSGTQPISNEDGSVWVVLNGEIYNFQSLRQELIAKGHTFRSQSDTECVVHAYEEYGDDCVQHLSGMFAFALWDESRKRLLMARDRLGKKPLLYTQLEDGLCFASEFQALLQVPNVRREINLGALGDYLAYGYVPGPATIYKNIYKLLPGHRLVWQEGSLRTEPYWALTYLPKLKISEQEALEELERLLTQAVRLRLVADVPVGALLSGGVDSSVVVALMAQNAGAGVKTFSIGFEDAAFDEQVHARRVAEMYGTDHHQLIVRPDTADVLPLLVRHYGEPYADSSAVPTYYVSKMARQHVTVALNGDGGDEAFAGYDRYRAMWLAEAFRTVPQSDLLLKAGARLAERLHWLPTRVRRRSLRLLNAAALPAGPRYARWMSMLAAGTDEELLDCSVADEVARERGYAVETSFAKRAGLQLTDRLLATDLATYLPDDLLVKADIASMANSLELRSPILDYQVMEFAARLPIDLKLRHHFEQKYLLKQLARKLIPHENIDRPKMGFGVPVGSWLRDSLYDMGADALLGRRARSRGYFQTSVVERLWQEHQSGRRDHTAALWTLLMFELWHREFIDAPPTAGPLPASAATGHC